MGTPVDFKTFSCFYHQVAVDRGMFNDSIRYSNRKDDTRCRFGCDEVETIQHVFFDCHFCLNAHEDLLSICREKNLVYSLKNLFTHRSLRCRVERFLDWVFAVFPLFDSFIFFHLPFWFTSFSCLFGFPCFCFLFVSGWVSFQPLLIKN